MIRLAVTAFCRLVTGMFLLRCRSDSCPARVRKPRSGFAFILRRDAQCKVQGFCFLPSASGAGPAAFAGSGQAAWSAPRGRVCAAAGRTQQPPRQLHRVCHLSDQCHCCQVAGCLLQEAAHAPQAITAATRIAQTTCACIVRSSHQAQSVLDTSTTTRQHGRTSPSHTRE